MEDITYYPTFQYNLLDTTDQVTLRFDSSAGASSPTGEIEAVRYYII
jgi:hypothetical protein